MRAWSISSQSETPISCPASEARFSKVAVFILNSCRFLRMAKFAHALSKSRHGRIGQSGVGEMRHGAEEIVAVRAEKTLGDRNARRHRFLAERAFIARMGAIEHEGEHTRPAHIVDLGVEPAWFVGAR